MKRLGKICIMMLVGILMATMLTASVTASPWSQGGNNIGSATAMGSTDNYDVYFITGNTEAMRIDTNQRIGIADSTPDFRLEVAGTSGNGYFGVSSSAGNDGNVFIIDSSGDIGIGTTNPSNKLTVSGDADFTGSVGIGTTSPSYKLDVKAWSVVGPLEFEGEIQDDMTTGGTYLGYEDLTYVVEIDGTGTPDTFKWSDDGGSTWDATGVEITGSAQSLNYGVTVTFTATTGHTLGDKWTFETYVTNPFSVQNAAGDQVFSVNNDGSFGINMTPTDSEYVLEVRGDVWFNSSIVKFGNNSLKAMGEHFKVTSTKYSRIIFDDNDEAADYYFAVGVHEPSEKNTPAYATNERFWIREDGKTGIGAQSPLGRLWVNTEPTSGTGEITSSDTTVTGLDTSFLTELKVGDEIWIEISHGPQPYDQQKNIRRVVTITSDISLEVDRPFTIWDKPTREEVQKDITSPTSFKYTRPILCVETNERVGISTISPTEKLDVNGKARVRNLNGYDPTDTIVTADSTGVLHDSGKTIGDLIDHDWYEEWGTDIPDDIDDNIYTNGKVGIGTSSPGYTLDVQADSTVGDPTFYGTGLNDLISSGTYRGSWTRNYRIQIETTGTPDKFKWSHDDGVTWEEFGVDITGNIQSLSCGVRIKFSSTTGHTQDDYWRITTTAINPLAVRNAYGKEVLFVGNGGSVGINDDSPSFTFEIDRGVEGEYLDLFAVSSAPASADGDAFIIKDSLYVGIGQTDPNRKLEIEDPNAQLRLTYDSTYSFYTDLQTIYNGYFLINPSGARVGIGESNPSGTLHVCQNDDTGQIPVLILDQTDVSENMIKFIGESTTDASQTLVDAADRTTPGSIKGWIKVHIEDEQATNPIPSGTYYIPFYDTPQA